MCLVETLQFVSPFTLSLILFVISVVAIESSRFEVRKQCVSANPIGTLPLVFSRTSPKPTDPLGPAKSRGNPVGMFFGNHEINLGLAQTFFDF